MDVTQSRSDARRVLRELLEITGTDRPAGCSDAPILWETTQGDEALVPGPGERPCECGSSMSTGSRLVVWAGQDS